MSLSKEEILFFQEQFKSKLSITVEQVLNYKFPNLKNLNVQSGKDDMLIITYENDGIHTQQMIGDYLEEVKNINYKL